YDIDCFTWFLQKRNKEKKNKEIIPFLHFHVQAVQDTNGQENQGRIAEMFDHKRPEPIEQGKKEPCVRNYINKFRDADGDPVTKHAQWSISKDDILAEMQVIFIRQIQRNHPGGVQSPHRVTYKWRGKKKQEKKNREKISQGGPCFCG